MAQISTKNGHKYFESASSVWDDPLEQPKCLNQKWQEEQGRDEIMAKWLLCINSLWRRKDKAQWGRTEHHFNYCLSLQVSLQKSNESSADETL